MSQLVANFDASSIRWADGSPIGRAFTTSLRRNGFHDDASNHRLTRTGHGLPRWEFRYLGADTRAGPNYTGQDCVTSHYHR